MSPAIEQLRKMGFDLSDSALEAIGNDYRADAGTLSFTDLLLGLGMGNYDFDTGKWTPYSSKVYAFDAEIFDIDNMYALFLQGIQAIVPDIKITNVREDLSKMTDEMTEPDDPMTPPGDGKRSVTFDCNGHEYTIELDSYGDWFNEKMFVFMDEVLQKEGCPLKLYEFQAQMQCVIVVYCSDDMAKELGTLIQPY